jgi:hypothetical protein
MRRFTDWFPENKEVARVGRDTALRTADTEYISLITNKTNTRITGCKCFSKAHNTGRFIVFSVIANIYNKKTEGLTLMELFTATGKLKKFF